MQLTSPWVVSDQCVPGVTPEMRVAHEETFGQNARPIATPTGLVTYSCSYVGQVAATLEYGMIRMDEGTVLSKLDRAMMGSLDG